MIIFNGAAATVTISGNLGFSAPNTSQTSRTFATDYNGTALSTTPTTIATVTAGKKFYMTSATLCGAAQGNIAIADAGTYKAAITQNGHDGICMTFPSPIEFSTNIQLAASGSMSCTWCITGFEQ